MVKRNTMAKVFAFLALFWIVLGIIGTGVLFIFWNNQSNNDIEKVQTVSPEELKKMIDSWEIKISTNTWTKN